MSELVCVNGHRYHMPFWGECPTCQGISNLSKQQRCGESIRRVKAAIENGRDREAYFETKTLRELGHPDVDGLCAQLKRAFELERAKAGGNKRRARPEDQ